MIKLEVLNHDGKSFRIYTEEVYVNPSCILMMKDGTDNICGTHYVHVLFTPEVMKVMPKSSTNLVCVKGTCEEVLQKINETHDDGFEFKQQIVVDADEESDESC